MHVVRGTESHKQQESDRMRSIHRSQESRLAIEGYLAAQRAGNFRQPGKFAVITRGVSLHPSQESLRRVQSRGSATQQIAGAIHVFYPSPDIVPIQEMQSGFRQIAVANLVFVEAAVATPEQCAGPVAAA